MPTVQSTYVENQPIALPGMAADADFSADTRICETAAGIPFGVVVSQGAADKGALIGAAAASNFVGITISDKTIQNDGGADGYNQYDNMAVMYRGTIWVTAGGAVNDGDDVTFNSTTGVLSSIASGAGQLVINGARWMTTAGNGGLAKIRLSGSLPSA